MSAFRVGQKVVCIDATWVGGQSPLIQDQVYTLVGFEKMQTGRHRIGKFQSSTLSVVLAEVKNPDPIIDGFASERFRPAVTQEQDVAQFTHHLIREGAPV